MSKGITKTKEAWQEFYAYELTDEDALEIDANLLAFITVLLEWEHEDSTSNGRSSDNANHDV